jgi:hypothetical protein
VLDDESIEKLYYKCRKIGSLYSQEISEDFPGWAVSAVLVRGYWVDIKWLLIDYFRSKFGRPEEQGEGVNNTRRALGGLVENRPINHEKTDPFKSWSKDWETWMGFLPNPERAAMILHDKYGFTFKEIGDVFGKSESSACQYYGKAIKKIRTIHKHSAD